MSSPAPEAPLYLIPPNKIKNDKMIGFSTVLITLSLLASVHAAPLAHTKRIAQNTVDAKTKWEAACVSPSNLDLAFQSI